ncbi:MAG: NYN domain-containing protein [Ruegeria sp.]
MASKPATLGEVISRNYVPKSGFGTKEWFWKSLLRLLSFVLLACIAALSLWCVLVWPDVKAEPAVVLLPALFFLWYFVYRKVRRNKRHFLFANDRQGFMRGLRLDKKTVVIDGSNIYHFGHDNGLDAQPLGEIAHLLRSQGYRIVCFFDANIFYTLGEHGAFRRGTRHSVAMIERIFGLEENEIYIVPSGVQADQYILECLKFMPISFAVTNDRYRDYASQYPTVVKDNLWRKGVTITGGETKLLHH